MTHTLRIVSLFAVAGLTATRLAAADPKVEVNVNSTLSEAGQKITHPTRAQPAYYFPVVAGWREEGATVAGEKPPPRLLVVHQLAKTLADEGYLVVSAKTPPPTLLLVFHWGYMNPQIDDKTQPTGTIDNPFFNQAQMLALVGGSTLQNLDLDFEREAVMQGAEDDRYFVIVTAYDFADAIKKKKTVLWQARMSVPSAGVTMEEVVPALIASGGPMFGRETKRPEWLTTPLAPEGHVNVGTPVVVPAAPPAEKAPPAEPDKK